VHRLEACATGGLSVHALPLILLVLAAMAIAYRFYSALVASYVIALDDQRPTPAVRLNDGQNYHPTNRWVLLGHHFAAISGAGPLIGPVLAIQFGYMPGLVWLVVGVCLAGAVQDMLVLVASVRHDGKSLAEMARRMLGTFPGTVAAIAILFIVIIALSGLGLIVVKALGGEKVTLQPGTRLSATTPWRIEPATSSSDRSIVFIPSGTTIHYPSGAQAVRSESFELIAELPPTGAKDWTLPAGVQERVAGSSWGTFTIACTIPIALLVGLYMYKIRPGRVLEASLLGAAGVLAATVAGNWIPGSPLEPYFSLSRESTIVAICIYGFIASVLPVWILLCPRDYLSSFLKIGTIILLVLGIMVANPKLEAPALNEHFAWGGGPNLPGAVFPFVFICIMCGAISGFHSLVSSGTTPKMLQRESDARLIGYGAMLLEGLVGVVALLAAATLPQGDYWAINIDLAKVSQFAPVLEKMGANADHLPQLEQQVGGESLRGRSGGAVTLAVGMAQIMTTAMSRVSDQFSMDSVIKYWFHFAIMFEALFILTTIDTGTRIARFLLQELLGKVDKRFERMDWLPGVLLSTAIVTLAWGGLIWTGSIDTIWPMFGIANQLLAAIALIVVTTFLIQSGRSRAAWVSVLPLLFVLCTTLTAAYQMVSGRFYKELVDGWSSGTWSLAFRGGLNMAAVLFLVSCMLLLLVRCVNLWSQSDRPPQPPVAGGRRSRAV
jgi:carbon starvation protein